MTLLRFNYISITTAILQDSKPKLFILSLPVTSLEFYMFCLFNIQVSKSFCGVEADATVGRFPFVWKYLRGSSCIEWIEQCAVSLCMAGHGHSSPLCCVLLSSSPTHNQPWIIPNNCLMATFPIFSSLSSAQSSKWFWFVGTELMGLVVPPTVATPPPTPFQLFYI